MTEASPRETRAGRLRLAGRAFGYGWIAIAALAMRLLHLWQTRDQPVARILMGDAQAYDAWARRIAGGDWLGSEVFYQSPLYPYWVAIIYRLTGGSVGAARVVQSVLGAASCVMLAKAAEGFFSRRVGWVVGTLMAVYPTAIFFDAIIQKSSLDLFLISLLLLLIARATRHSSGRAWLAMGVVVGATTLNRENALLLAVPLVVWVMLLHGLASKRWIEASACCALGCALVLGPVAIRNFWVGGELHVTTSQFGPNFFIGNHPGASGRYEPLRWGRGSAEFERNDAVELAEKARGRKLSPGEVSRYWFERGWSYVRTQPWDWLELMGRKALLLVNAVEITDTEDQYTWAEGSSPLSATGSLLHMGVVVPLAAIGIVVTFSSNMRRTWILHALLLTYALSVLLFFVTSRYRYPLLPMLMLLAAVAVTHPWRRWLSERRYQAICIAVLAATVTSLAANRSIVDTDTMRAATMVNLGTDLAEHGDQAKAAEYFLRATKLQPEFAEAHYNLGLALIDLDRLDEAVAPFTRAAELLPDAPGPRQALRWIQNRKQAAGRGGEN